ncbi:hypothetical protein B0J14DRAFT_655362 [Halenospora varia]|nr:hypothetical protein B0J14DRAFT_655362 [Halenospora varia]
MATGNSPSATGGSVTQTVMVVTTVISSTNSGSSSSPTASPPPSSTLITLLSSTSTKTTTLYSVTTIHSPIGDPTATPSKSGLSLSDKIALEVAIGIGVPTFIVTAVACCIATGRYDLAGSRM